MIRYLETFYRHRLLLLIPIVLALAVSVGVALAQPKTYESTARIWSDGQGNNQDLGYPSADELAATLRELLQTRSFDVKVAERGPLAGYLATAIHASDEHSPPVDDAVWNTLSRHVDVQTVGPHVVTATFDASDPTLAAGTLQAAVDQFLTEVLDSRRARTKATVDFYAGQVKTQEAELLSLDDRIARYVQAHPAQRGIDAAPDATLTELRRSGDLAVQRYEFVVGKLDQAQLALAVLDQPGVTGVRVIDAPELSYHAKGFLKRLAYAGVAGLMVGFVIFGLALLALTQSDRGVRSSSELEGVMGRRVVGSIPRLR